MPDNNNKRPVTGQTTGRPSASPNGARSAANGNRNTAGGGKAASGRTSGGAAPKKPTARQPAAGAPPAASQQVSLAQKAGVSSPAPAPKQGAKKKAKKTRSAFARTVLSLVLVAVMILTVVFLVGMINYVYKNYIELNEEEVRSVNLDPYQKTAEADRDKVAYYVLGLLGEETASATEMISLVCHDKVAGTLNVMQIPAATYLGDHSTWTTNRLDAVWGNPRKLDWCPTHQKEVPASEIKDGKHTECGTMITQLEGSAGGDLGKVFNHLFGVPVDAHFMLPQQGLVKLVNLLDGIDINVKADKEIEKIKYSKGQQIVTGDAALYYSLRQKNTDIERMVESRQIFLALFQHLTSQSTYDLEYNSVGALQASSTPIRTNLKRSDVIKTVESLKGIEPKDITCYVMPGHTAKVGGKEFYSANTAELLKLLNDKFLPHHQKLTEETLGIPQTGKATKVDLKEQKMDAIAVTQSGIKKEGE